MALTVTLIPFAPDALYVISTKGSLAFKNDRIADDSTPKMQARYFPLPAQPPPQFAPHYPLTRSPP